jgi:hypothetical protein
MTAIRASIVPPNYGLKIDISHFPKDISGRILQTWSARNMLPIAHNWPDISSPLLNEPNHLPAKAQRLWWYLRTQTVSMTESSGVTRAKMFEFVEQLTNKTDSGPIVFSLHQYLLGIDMTNPICDL